MDWVTDVVSLAEEFLFQSISNRPTIIDIYEFCDRWGLQLAVGYAPRPRGCVLGNCIVAHAPDSGALTRVCIHEITEWLLRQEILPPFQYIPSGHDDRHKVACAVEKHLRNMK